MAEVNSYNFTYREIVELLIKAADVHEGMWMPMFQFGLAAGNFGPSPAELTPGAAVLVANFGIQRVTDPNPQENSLTVDAANVNPVKGGKGPS